MIFIIGGKGRLGQAIMASYPKNEVTLLDRSIYQDWWHDNSSEKIVTFFSQWSNSNSIIFVTAGLLDPELSIEKLLRVNYLLPMHIIEGAAKIGLRVLTFGTVMEKFFANKNPYIYSKALLGNYISTSSAAEGTALHLRLHTLYGGTGLPSPFMFLGQIYLALKSQIVFKMTSGNQLREYHHIDDDVQAIPPLVDAKTNGIIDLNHGKPINLKDMASYIFQSFHCENLLHINALPEPKEENYGEVLQRPEALKNFKFRETLPSIVTYLRTILTGETNNRGISQ